MFKSLLSHYFLYSSKSWNNRISTAHSFTMQIGPASLSMWTLRIGHGACCVDSWDRLWLEGSDCCCSCSPVLPHMLDSKTKRSKFVPWTPLAKYPAIGLSVFNICKNILKCFKKYFQDIDIFVHMTYVWTHVPHVHVDIRGQLREVNSPSTFKWNPKYKIGWSGMYAECLYPNESY